jgi:hypothetical protein
MCRIITNNILYLAPGFTGGSDLQGIAVLYEDLKGKKVLVTGSSSGIGQGADINLGLTKSKMPVR